METIVLLLLVAGLQIAAAASPGPNFILVSRYATSQSIHKAIAATAGIVVGILIWSSLAILGLGALVASSPLLYATVQFLGAAYLLWLGLGLLISSFRAPMMTDGADKGHKAQSPFVKGFLVNIGNPKTIAYYTSLFAVLIPAEASIGLISAVVIVDASACGLWWIFVALLFGSAPVKRAFSRWRRWIDRLFGAALVALGVKLAFDRG